MKETPETDAIAALLDRGFKHESIKAISKLERERDEARNANTNNLWEQWEIDRAKIVGELAYVKEERDQLRQDKETMEIRHAAAMMHTQAIVDENTQLRKVVDELYRYCDRPTDRARAAIELYNQLPHVKERNESK